MTLALVVVAVAVLAVAVVYARSERTGRDSIEGGVREFRREMRALAPDDGRSSTDEG